MNKLLPCPFCGVELTKNDKGRWMHPSYIDPDARGCYLDDCVDLDIRKSGCRVEVSENWIEEWNKRVPEAEMEAVAEGEPKPCPFCGKKIFRGMSGRAWGHGTTALCILGGCNEGLGVNIYDAQLKKWNHRMAEVKEDE